MNNALRIQMLIDFVRAAMAEDCTGVALSDKMERAERWIAGWNRLNEIDRGSGEAQDLLEDLEETEKWWLGKNGKNDAVVKAVSVPEGPHFIHASIPPNTDAEALQELAVLLSNATGENCEYVLITPVGLEFEALDKAHALKIADRLEVIVKELRELDTLPVLKTSWN